MKHPSQSALTYVIARDFTHAMAIDAVYAHIHASKSIEPQRFGHAPWFIASAIALSACATHPHFVAKQPTVNTPYSSQLPPRTTYTFSGLSIIESETAQPRLVLAAPTPKTPAEPTAQPFSLALAPASPSIHSTELPQATPAAPALALAPLVATQHDAVLKPPVAPSFASFDHVAKPIADSLATVSGYPLGSVALPAVSAAVIESITERARTAGLVVITGYADRTGTEAVNRATAIMRAANVRSALMLKGIPPSRFRIFYSVDAPSRGLASANDPRRVELLFLRSPPTKLTWQVVQSETAQARALAHSKSQPVADRYARS
jgi:outer membrane protein OmpA-like peptidoglycan-associated protein